MKERTSLCDPCSLNRERDSAFAVKYLALPTRFLSAENSEEQMMRALI